MMRGSAEDLAGRKFGRLIAVEMCGHNKHNQRLWLWRCDCGNEIRRVSGPIKHGRQISCGCHRDEQSGLRATHGRSNSRTYKAWRSMKSRCAGTNGASSKHYHGRGIRVCARWLDSFENFLADMGECPKGLTLERDKNDMGYEPGNCRWATQADQVKNTRRTIRVKLAGRVMCLKDACAMAGVSYQGVRGRIRLGKEPQAALDEWRESR